MMRMLMVLVAVGLTAATGALARAPELSVSDTRPFGYFIGDAIHREVVLRLAPGDVLDTASLPRPGPLNYWLELSKADLSTGSEGEDTLYRLSLVYQTFYAPLDTRALVIPAFKLKVTGAQDSEVNVPAFSFLMSPIRQLFTDKGQSSDSVTKLRPDRPAPREPTGRERTLMLVSGLARTRRAHRAGLAQCVVAVPSAPSASIHGRGALPQGQRRHACKARAAIVRRC